MIVLRSNEVPEGIRRYFVPFVRSPKYHSIPLVNDSPYRILRCTAGDLARNVELRSFVRQGELRLGREFDNTNLEEDWYVVSQVPAVVLWQRRFAERHIVLFNAIGALSYDFYRLTYRHRIPSDYLLRAATAFLSSFAWLGKEVYGRTNLGEGALKVEGTDISRIPIVGVEHVPAEALKYAESLLNRECLDLREEFDQDDRRSLDAIVARNVGLNGRDLKEVYEGIVKLVTTRLEKAEHVQA